MAKDGKTQTNSKGQIEMSMKETPLFRVCERMTAARKAVITAKTEMEEAEKAWCEEMKKLKKGKINHSGDIIQFVSGRTSKDHARYCKS